MSINPAIDGFQIRSPVMKEIYQEIYDYAYHNRPCIFLGPSGCGKEFAARYYFTIWNKSNHGNGKFVTFNCAMVTDTMARSELFGHKKWAFTDARYENPGLFDEAKNGVLFLDEISDLPVAAQSMILRAIDPEVHKARRLGANEDYDTKSVRVIAAMNRQISEIREDLLFRLGMQVIIPGLAERTEDIEPAIEYFTARAFIKRNDRDQLYEQLFGQTENIDQAWQSNKNILSLSQNIAERLKHDAAQRIWTGNFRSLRINVETAVIRSKDSDCEESFIDETVRLFKHHAQTYSEQKNYFVDDLPAEKEPTDITTTPAFRQIDEALPKMKPEEKNKWAQCFEAMTDSMFRRRDIEHYFPPDFYSARTFQNRLKKMEEAGIILRCGSKGDIYQLSSNADIMPLQKKQHPDLFNMPQNPYHENVNPRILTTLTKLLDRSRHLFIGGQQRIGKTSLALALGKEINQNRSVYYYNIDESELGGFFRILIQKLQQEKIGVQPHILSVEEYSPHHFASLLCGYVDVLFQNDNKPLMILDSVQNIVKENSKKALEALLQNWQMFQFILVGHKLSVNMEQLGIIEYTIIQD